jgi:hypothetical protein
MVLNWLGNGCLGWMLQFWNTTAALPNMKHVWERGCGCVPKKFEFFFFLLKFKMVCMVWIVLMC